MQMIVERWEEQNRGADERKPVIDGFGLGGEYCSSQSTQVVDGHRVLSAALLLRLLAPRNGQIFSRYPEKSKRSRIDFATIPFFEPNNVLPPRPGEEENQRYLVCVCVSKKGG